MMQRIQDILDEYTATDEERRTENQTRLSGLFVLHRLPNAD